MSSIKNENSYLNEKDIEKINKVPPQRPQQPPPQPPPILRIIDSDQYVSFVATAATAAVPPPHPRPPPYVAINMPDGCIKEPGCIKETRKACAIWLTYCVCVNQLFLLKIMIFCAAMALSIMEVYFAFKTQEGKTMMLVSIDGELLLVMLGLFFFMEYVLFNSTREVMLNHNRNLECLEWCNKIKYNTYLCLLALKIIVTSVALSFLVKKANGDVLIPTVSVILGGQCIMILWCLKKKLQI
jgi:hypothetical protein